MIEKKLYCTAWTEEREQALRDVDLKRSCKRGIDRTEALASLY